MQICSRNSGRELIKKSNKSASSARGPKKQTQTCDPFFHPNLIQNFFVIAFY